MYTILFEHHELSALEYSHDNTNEKFVSVADLCDWLNLSKIRFGEFICKNSKRYKKFVDTVDTYYQNNYFLNCDIIILVIMDFSKDKYFEYKAILDETFSNDYDF